METVSESVTSTEWIYFVIMMFMGYAIALSYFLIFLVRKDMGYLRKDNGRDLKYLREDFERDFQRIKDENNELRHELHNLKRKG